MWQKSLEGTFLVWHNNSKIMGTEHKRVSETKITENTKTFI